MAVAAVAGPAAAQGLPALPDLEATAEDTFADAFGLSVTIACSTELCGDSPGGDCPPVEYGISQRWPGFHFEVDPNYCIRGMADCIMENGLLVCLFPPPPQEVLWTFVDADALAATGDPAPSSPETPQPAESTEPTSS